MTNAVKIIVPRIAGWRMYESQTSNPFIQPPRPVSTLFKTRMTSATHEVSAVAAPASTARFVKRGTEMELRPIASCVRSDMVRSVV